MKTTLKKLYCPICGNPMDVRIKNSEQINKVSKSIKKQKYYQYYCNNCDDDNTGWTSTESDELSLKLK